MRAVVLENTRRIAVRDVPDAEMRQTTDALLRITSTAICGTDLHFYESRMRGVEGHIIGHEPLGVVEEVGSAVKGVQKIRPSRGRLPQGRSRTVIVRSNNGIATGRHA